MKVSIQTNWWEDGQSFHREVTDFNEIKDLLSDRNISIVLNYPPAVLQMWIEPSSKCNAIYFENNSPVEYFLYPDSLKGPDMGGVEEHERFFKADHDTILEAAEYFFEHGMRKPGMYWHEFPYHPLTERERVLMDKEMQMMKKELDQP